ncbi:hypothetical protein EJ03DRAFT_332247 [Teratosphaeria nubilosa]|uniref:Xaa-Pro dipeptidyl-peptidase-like domain-containing protein n=1 Tax=Teratosphaeria nubilosa TaxID=161662 RepID=A0A6G1KV04_9PEZI|nr:hypothetical protein EJ03DRAFT_332247 [Teratosphaeria nubilosa]
MAPKAAYSFTLPSIEDDTVLDCRIYHPADLESMIFDTEQLVKGAVVAHPYAPLGGSYDDPVVLTVAQTLLDQGLVVATFNFRGAGASQGKSSWSGRGEVDDFVSVVGFLVWYLQCLNDEGDSGDDAGADGHEMLEILLAGYSYGALILARLPEMSSIVQRLQVAELGTAGAEIILRARTLAKQTLQAPEDQADSSRGRPSRAGKFGTESPWPKSSAIKVGGEETPSTDRRRSRDSRRSVDFVRRSVEAPSRIKQHLRKHSDERAVRARPQSARPKTANAVVTKTGPRVTARYLVISPVLLPIPFTTILAPPGVPGMSFGHRRVASEDHAAGVLFTRHPTLVLFGTKDTFISDKQLRLWGEKLQKASKVNDFRWKQIQDAGHFWREEGAMTRLQDVVASWVRLQGCRAPHIGYSG